MNKNQNNFLCPCGTGKKYLECCGIFITNKKSPATPEELMRSRYTAYNLIDIDYIIQTMKSPAADNFDAEEVKKSAKKITWTGLKIVKTSHDANKGIVEFIAQYNIDGQRNILHEISEFNCEDGKWYYVKGMYP